MEACYSYSLRHLDPTRLKPSARVPKKSSLLRTDEPKASEFACTTPSEEDLTDTEVEMSGAGALQSPRSTPVKMSIDHFHKWRRILLFPCIHVN